ncbi:unnamed protein product, partial [Porites evermanni]
GFSCVTCRTCNSIGQSLSLVIRVTKSSFFLGLTMSVHYQKKRWTQIQEYSLSNTYLILVGNKCDMEKDRAVTYEKEKRLTEQTGLEFFETSAKDNVSVLRVFERLVELMMSDANNDNNKDRYKMLKCWRLAAQKLTTNGDKIIETPW